MGLSALNPDGIDRMTKITIPSRYDTYAIAKSNMTKNNCVDKITEFVCDSINMEAKEGLFKVDVWVHTFMTINEIPDNALNRVKAYRDFDFVANRLRERGYTVDSNYTVEPGAGRIVMYTIYWD